MSKKYKVTGCVGARHGFEIGDVVVFECLVTSRHGFFRRKDGLHQIVTLIDVKPVEEPVKRSFIDIIKGWFNRA